MHWTALDGMRGVAVLAVLAYHFGLVPVGSGGWLGVDVFFVVSGFVVTRALARHRRSGADTSDFLLRRAARLLPALAVYLAAVVAVVLAQPTGRTAELRAAAASAAQIANLEMIAAGPATTPTMHLWSLSIEWQFYLLLPMVAVWVSRRRLQRLVLVAAGLAVVSAVLRVVVLAVGASSPWATYLATPTRLDGLLAGVALAMLAPSRRPLPAACSWAAVALLVAALLEAPRWYDAPRVSLAVALPVAAVATAVLVAATVDRSLPRPLERVLSSRPLQWVGERSYSIYLWHLLIGVVLLGDGETWQGVFRFALQVTASIAVAAVAYTLVERPARLALTARIDERRGRCIAAT